MAERAQLWLRGGQEIAFDFAGTAAEWRQKIEARAVFWIPSADAQTFVRADAIDAIRLAAESEMEAPNASQTAQVERVSRDRQEAPQLAEVQES
jgi:hypothetical protein